MYITRYRDFYNLSAMLAAFISASNTKDVFIQMYALYLKKPLFYIRNNLFGFIKKENYGIGHLIPPGCMFSHHPGVCFWKGILKGFLVCMSVFSSFSYNLNVNWIVLISLMPSKVNKKDSENINFCFDKLSLVENQNYKPKDSFLPL